MPTVQGGASRRCPYPFRGSLECAETSKPSSTSTRRLRMTRFKRHPCSSCGRSPALTSPRNLTKLHSWLRSMKSPESPNVCCVLWKQPHRQKIAKKRPPKPNFAPPSALESSTCRLLLAYARDKVE